MTDSQTLPLFQQSQLTMTAHLRNPELNAGPADVEDRRLGIYRELIYNNIEGFIDSGFPILRELTADDHWHRMIRDFIARHESHSPYFLEITQEFLRYLQEERGAVPGDPAFMLELAHYEWVELALDVSEEQFPQGLDRDGDLLEGQPVVSPLAWSLSYHWPVHRIGPEFQPQEAGEAPTFLVVYRNRQDEVQFMESNAVTVRLLQLMSAEPAQTGRELLAQIAEELQHPEPEALVRMGHDLLRDLLESDVICGVRKA